VPEYQDYLEIFLYIYIFQLSIWRIPVNKREFANNMGYIVDSIEWQKEFKDFKVGFSPI